MRAPIPSYYEVLQVERDAPAEQIRLAYRRMAQRYHPDKSPDNVHAPRVMANLNKAYEVLSDPARREEHDRWIAGQENPARARGASVAVSEDTTRWPWLLLFVTSCCAVAALGTVAYLNIMQSRAAVHGTPNLPRMSAPSAAGIAMSGGAEDGVAVHAVQLARHAAAEERR